VEKVNFVYGLVMNTCMLTLHISSSSLKTNIHKLSRDTWRRNFTEEYNERV